MFKKSTANRRRDTNQQAPNLEFVVDDLEDRKMLAADVDIVGGDSLRITGDNSSETVSVSMNDAGFVTVDGQSTGLTQLKNLSINLRGGNDNLIVSGSGSNALNVTGRTTIRLGSGSNRLEIGGQHNNLRVSGGRGADQVFASHQIRNATTNVSLRGGNDAFSFDTGMIEDAESIGRADLSNLLDALFSNQTISLPKFNLNLGGGNDLVSMSDVRGGQETSIRGSELDPQTAGLLFVGANVNGASGTDTLSPVQLTQAIVDTASDFGTRVRGFEAEADLSVNIAPNAVDDLFFIAEGGIVAKNVLANDTDPDGDVLELTNVNGFGADTQFDVVSAGGRTGSASFNASGAIIFNSGNSFNDLGLGESDSVTLTYTVSDGDLTSTATFTVEINGFNRAPFAVDDISNIAKFGTARVDVLANDFDTDGDDLELTTVNGFGTGVQFDVISAGGRLGSAFFSAAGEITFFAEEFGDLGPGQSDSVVLTYTVSDGNETSTATLTVGVIGF